MQIELILSLISLVASFGTPVIMSFLMRKERQSARAIKQLLAETKAELIKSQTKHTDAQVDVMLDKTVDDASIALIKTLREQLDSMQAQIVTQNQRYTAFEKVAREFRVERTILLNTIQDAVQIINELLRGVKAQNNQLLGCEITPAWIMSQELEKRVESTKEWGKL